jgi:hypothetical protein
MTWQVLRGFFSVLAAATGSMLLYGFIFAMEGMTTRVPDTWLHELATTTIWMLPWTILFCFGLEDFDAVTRRPWVFWAGAMLVMMLLYYFERNTSSSVTAKIVMPPLATAAGLSPHVIRQIHFVFNIFSIGLGVVALVILYRVVDSYFSGSSFSTKGIEMVVFTFGLSSLIGGVLSVVLLGRREAEIA